MRTAEDGAKENAIELIGQCPFGTEGLAADEMRHVLVESGVPEFRFGPLVERLPLGMPVSRAESGDSPVMRGTVTVTLLVPAAGATNTTLLLRDVVRRLVGLRSLESLYVVFASDSAVSDMAELTRLVRSSVNALLKAVHVARAAGVLDPYRPPIPIPKALLVANRPFGGRETLEGRSVCESKQAEDEEQLQITQKLLEEIAEEQVSTTEPQERIVFRASAVRLTKPTNATYNSREVAFAFGDVLGELFPEWPISMRFANLDFVALVSEPRVYLTLKLHASNNSKGALSIEAQFASELQRRAIGQAIATYRLRLDGARYAVGTPSSFKHDVRLRKGNNSMNPAIAHFLVHVAEVRRGDILLDPLGGTGTIPMECVIAQPGAVAIGGDVSRSDVANQVENFSEDSFRGFMRAYARLGSGQSTESFQCLAGGRWTAKSLPFRNGVVDVIVSDLPFGKRCGNTASNTKLYPAMFEEFWRVLRPGGRLVVLTLETQIVEQILHSEERWRLVAPAHHIDMNGLFPVVYALQRNP